MQIPIMNLKKCMWNGREEVPVFNTHMIRKTVATKMHFAGIPSRMIADMLGHADISTTEKCYILTDAEYAENMSHALKDVFNY